MIAFTMLSLIIGDTRDGLNKKNNGSHTHTECNERNYKKCTKTTKRKRTTVIIGRCVYQRMMMMMQLLVAANNYRSHSPPEHDGNEQVKGPMGGHRFGNRESRVFVCFTPNFELLYYVFHIRLPIALTFLPNFANWSKTFSNALLPHLRTHRARFDRLASQHYAS